MLVWIDGERYELCTPLARRGARSVWLGRDHALCRDVAVKMLHDDHADGADVARFEREVEMLTRVDHSNLTPLYDAGTTGRDHYLVMPFVAGGTLADHIQNGPLPTETIAGIGVAVAGALGYLHGRGVVHRDVKPSNVLLGDDGEILLADLGIASREEGDTTLTPSGALVGTAAYLAPEQLEGAEPNGACDVYALGLVLLEAFTTVRAYQGTQIEQAMAKLICQPEIPSSIDPFWARLIADMTSRDPRRRPDATTVVRTIRNRRHPVAVVNRRRRGWAAAGVTACVCLFGGTSWPSTASRHHMPRRHILPPPTHRRRRRQPSRPPTRSRPNPRRRLRVRRSSTTITTTTTELCCT